MEIYFYYLAAFLTVFTTGFGALFVLFSLIAFGRGTMRSDLKPTLPLILAHLFNGILNLCIGSILFWRLERTEFSIYATLIITTLFALLESFGRRYYTEKLEPRNL